jgi:hypothetical protein
MGNTGSALLQPLGLKLRSILRAIVHGPLTEAACRVTEQRNV